jgi:hypothetical protein
MQKIYNGIAGGVNQNAGFSQSNIYGGGTNAVLGAAAVKRAFSEGFNREDILNWANKESALIGPEAKNLLEI